MKRVRRIPLVRPALKLRRRGGTTAAQWKPLPLTWQGLRRPTAARQARRPGGSIIHNIWWSPRLTANFNLTFAAPARPERAGALPIGALPILWHRSPGPPASIRTLARSLRSEEVRRLHQTVSHSTAHHSAIRTSLRLEFHRIQRTRSDPPCAIASAAPGLEPTVDSRRYRSPWVRDAGSWLRRSVVTSSTRQQLTQVTNRSRNALVFTRTEQHPPPTPRPSPQLVWRTQPQIAQLEAIERSIAAATSPAVPFAAPGGRHSLESSAPSELAPARMLDPAQIDRFADEVIGRVERRIRIERERRGA